jgi:bifunctional UDP-N-acetylglucosamine pyrophosphorylase/glucosamine-1-phosphate N-acetyltransferase
MIGDRPLAVVILAAGEGTRMKSDMAKVLHKICGKSMIRHILSTVARISPSRTIVVVGHQAEAVMAELDGENVEFVKQEKRLGTGHAAMQTEPLLARFEGTVMVLNGDTPLLGYGTLVALLAFHGWENASATVMSAVLDDPAGYGRIVRDYSSGLIGIVEDGDATDEQRAIKEINSGIFCFEREDLFDSLQRVGRRNVQGEYYLTDVMGIMKEEGKKTAVFTCENSKEVIGINDRAQLEEAERIMMADG